LSTPLPWCWALAWRATLCRGHGKPVVPGERNATASGGASARPGYCASVPTIQRSPIEDVLLVVPDVHGDERGRFVETYRRQWLPLGREMVQGNRSEKQAGAIVGLHYHLHQADYWYLLRGRARVVLHDLREGSPTDGVTETIVLDGSEDRGLFIPPGVAHGFAALSDLLLWYLVDGYYNPADELGLAWDDPDVGAMWGVVDPVLSDRDRNNPRRTEIAPEVRPRRGLRT
jgi:dTDP-4-dehydrorhamnose 3,5-epimerase